MFIRRIVHVLQYNLGARSDDMDDGLLSAEISSAIETFYIVSLKKIINSELYYLRGVYIFASKNKRSYIKKMALPADRQSKIDSKRSTKTINLVHMDSILKEFAERRKCLPNSA